MAYGIGEYLAATAPVPPPPVGRPNGRPPVTGPRKPGTRTAPEVTERVNTAALLMVGLLVFAMV